MAGLELHLHVKHLREIRPGIVRRSGSTATDRAAAPDLESIRLELLRLEAGVGSVRHLARSLHLQGWVEPVRPRRSPAGRRRNG